MGVEVHVALPPRGLLIPQYKAEGITTHFLNCDLPIRQPWTSFMVFYKLKRLIQDINPDLIHSHFVGTTLTTRLALGRAHPIPRLFQVPGPLHLEHTFFRNLEFSLAGTNDYWIASCEATKKHYLKESIPCSRLFLSYYGTEIERFFEPRLGKLRREIGIHRNTKVVGMVAFMYAPKWYLGQKQGLKGHEDLIDALTLIAPRIPNILGIFVGGAWDKAKRYEKQIYAYGKKQLGERAVFLGTRNDVLDLYPDFDVAVHPSHSENVGGTVESFLMGIPTIATNVGGHPDLVIPGITGWLVPPSSPEKLAEAIIEVLRQPEKAHQMALQGQKLARHLFDVTRTSKEIYEIYQRILNNNLMN